MAPKKGKQPQVQENVSLGPQVAEGNYRRPNQPLLSANKTRHSGREVSAATLSRTRF
ncbi:uncharacterized protein KY384_002164 [Bacidia gigantensis]|uniref:uncharacterized protein n=1 Tax=Bacidia gigantensis TaxID=2732470 RepID=UPI001D04C8EC|nr:uncharacterized protein KY384_002164 [Bacidia gigantensis]KAG8533381.1 hypothetical protein KY384_002164 [Bacidia gigantensis]